MCGAGSKRDCGLRIAIPQLDQSEDEYERTGNGLQSTVFDPAAARSGRIFHGYPLRLFFETDVVVTRGRRSNRPMRRYLSRVGLRPPAEERRVGGERPVRIHAEPALF